MYKEVNKLNQTDAAYIAGLIDGEGTVTLSRRHRNENRQVVISIKTYKAKRSDIILRDYIRLTPGSGHYSPEIRQARTDFEQRVMKIKC